MKQKQIGKTICYFLRHAPQKAGLCADEFGWVSLAQLILALQERGIMADIDFIERLNLSSDKIRWEIDVPNNRIRATHGHSYPVVVGSSTKPPDVLYHGTSSCKLPVIFEQGLLPMSRQFVHLSTDKQTARAVGKRHGEPSVIQVDAKALFEENHPFYQTSDDVWLTESIPANFLSIDQ